MYGRTFMQQARAPPWSRGVACGLRRSPVVGPHREGDEGGGRAEGVLVMQWSPRQVAVLPLDLGQSRAHLLAPLRELSPPMAALASATSM